MILDCDFNSGHFSDTDKVFCLKERICCNKLFEKINPSGKVIMKEFGTVKDEKVYLFTLANKNGMSVDLSTLGATITAIRVPDKDGKTVDVAQFLAERCKGLRLQVEDTPNQSESGIECLEESIIQESPFGIEAQDIQLPKDVRVLELTEQRGCHLIYCRGLVLVEPLVLDMSEQIDGVAIQLVDGYCPFFLCEWRVPELNGQ